MNKHFVFYWLLPLFLLLVLIGIITYSFRSSAVIEKAAGRLADLEQSNFVLRLVMDNDTATGKLLGEKGVIEIDLTGAFDRLSREREVLAAAVDITARTESASLVVGGDVRFIDDAVYFYIKRSPQVFPALVALKDKWIKLPRTLAAKLEPSSRTSVIFTDVKKIGTEKYDGKSAVKYEARATREAVVQFMDEVADILGTQLSTEQIKAIREGTAQSSSVPTMIWRKAGSYDIIGLQTQFTTSGGNNIDFTLQLDSSQPIADIVVPENALLLDDLIPATIN